MDEMQVIESDFALGEVKVGIELLNGLPVGKGAGDVDLPIGMRIGDGAAGLYGKIGFAGDGIVVSDESLDRREICVMKVGSEIEDALAGDVAMLESGGSVEPGESVLTAQSGAAKGNRIEGKLDHRRKRIPVRLKVTRVGGGGQGNVEVIYLQSSAKLRREEWTAHVPIESGFTV